MHIKHVSGVASGCKFDQSTILLECPPEYQIQITVIGSRLTDTAREGYQCYHIGNPWCGLDVDGDRLTKLKQDCDGQGNCNVNIIEDECTWKGFLGKTDYQTITYTCKHGEIKIDLCKKLMPCSML